MVVTGSSGGHILPAKAVLEQWIAQKRPCIWVGRKDSLEAKTASQVGAEFATCTPVNIRQLHIRRPIQAIRSLISWYEEINQLFEEHQPKVILLTGSYITLMPAIVAKKRGVKIIVHEQNQVKGFANQLIQQFADQLLSAYPLKGYKLVGNPVSAGGIYTSDRIRKLLVLGGSQGSQFLNDSLPKILNANESIEVIHVCGKDCEKLMKAYQNANIRATVISFSHQMSELYTWADLVVCRAGAMTLAEIAAYGLPAVTVPLPSASRNHQVHNATYYEQQGAVVVVKQCINELSHALRDLMQTPAKCKALSKQVATLHRPDAAEQIIKWIKRMSCD